jgi:hypothetical protein
MSFEFLSRNQAQRNIQSGSFNALKTLSVFIDTDDRIFLDDFAITFFAPRSDLRACRLTEAQALNAVPQNQPNVVTQTHESHTVRAWRRSQYIANDLE